MELRSTWGYPYEKLAIEQEISEKGITDKLEIQQRLKFSANEATHYDNLSWFGGEPLLHFYEIMYSLAKLAKSLCDKDNIPYISSAATNAFCIDEKMVPFLNEIGLNSFQITLDGNEQMHDKIRFGKNKECSFRTIIDNINLLAEYPNTTSTMAQFYETLKQNN